MSNLPEPQDPRNEDVPELPVLVKKKNNDPEEDVEDSCLHDIAMGHLKCQKDAIQKVSAQLDAECIVLDELAKPERIKRAKRRIKARRGR